MSRRSRRSFRPLSILLVILVLLPVVAAAGAYVFVDPNSFKPGMIEAVRRATGRDLTLTGPLSIGFTPSPTVMASNVGFANPPGFSRPQMVSVGKVEVRLAVLPLLWGRVEIARLVLTNPDIVLETTAIGAKNWQFVRDFRPTAPPPDTAIANPGRTEATPPQPPRFAIGAIEIDDGRVGWHNGQSGVVREIAIKHLTAAPIGANASISASADVTVGGHDIALTADTGSLDSLLASEAIAPGWPFQVVAHVEGARLAASGTVIHPMTGQGYRLALDATVPDLGPLAPLLGRPLPPLHDVSASAKLSDATGVPVISNVMLRAGRSDLKAVADGLTLDRFEVAAPAMDQSMRAELDATRAGTKLHVVGVLGAPVTFSPGDASKGPGFMVDLRAEAAGTTVTAKGAILSPATMSGIAVAITAAVPDLAALSAMMGRPLPELKGLTFGGQLSDAADGLVLHAMKLTGPPGDVAGDLDLGFAPRLSVRGKLTSQRLEVDAMWASLLSAPVVLPPTAPATPAGAAPLPVNGMKAAPRRVITDRPFNLEVFDRLDVDVQATVAELDAGGFTARDVAGHLVLNQGKLALDPFTANLLNGHLDMHFDIDTRPPEPPMTLVLNAPGLALKPVLTAFGLPDDATGTIELAADVSASGRSPHALAASLSGRVGAILTEGEIDNRLLSAPLAAILHAARLPIDLSAAGGGRTHLRCFATRIDAAHGVANLATLVLDTNKVLIQGTGTMNLGDEVMALRLRPLLRTGGLGVVIPVKVTGSMAAPAVTVDQSGALQGLAGGLLGNLGRLKHNPVGAVATALGERGEDACGPALAAARGVQPTMK